MGEFNFINSIKQLFSSLPNNGFVGIGDDCAILDRGDESLLFTTDMLQEDIHFLRKSTSAYDLGWKSLAVNLSDIAAMGGEPMGSMLSISLPKELQGEWADEFMRGYHALSAKYNVPLIGGDTTSSKNQLTINVVAIGRAHMESIKRRSDAQVGDVILVNGSLGESGDGLAHILKGEENHPNITIHHKPTPQVEEGKWLGARTEVHAMMDISDGIASDLRHIMEQSKVGANIETTAIPTSTTLELALTAGEDYKLLLTAHPESVKELCCDYLTTFGTPLYPIGIITNENCLQWLENDTPLDTEFMGFQHL